MGLPADVHSEDDDLVKLIRTARSLTEESEFVTKVNGRVYGELGGLAKYLAKMMKTIEAIEQPMHASASELPKAADQLSDLTRLTEEATHRILGYTEEVMANHETMAAELASAKAACGNAFPTGGALERCLATLESRIRANRKLLTDLLTSLEFQDLAGQRLKKVAAGIQEVQSRILRLLIVFGFKDGGGASDAGRQEALLAKLDASTKTALNQQVVDDILKEFGF